MADRDATKRNLTKRRILKALCDVSDNFKEHSNEIHFVGSTVDWLKGEKEFFQVGDVDILIDGKGMAGEFWRFTGGLLCKGFLSVWDIEVVPESIEDLWKHCHRGRKLHPTALALSCDENALNHKWFNLDFQIDNQILPSIEESNSWRYDENTPFWKRPSSKKPCSPDPLSFELAVPEVRKFLKTEG